jgi:hypothetical protein
VKKFGALCETGEGSWMPAFAGMTEKLVCY